jgi:hypothetical protein
MKVKEMIEELSQLDPEADVGICVVNGDDVHLESVGYISVKGVGTRAEIGVVADWGPIPTTI